MTTSWWKFIIGLLVAAAAGMVVGLFAGPVAATLIGTIGGVGAAIWAIEI